MDQNFATITEQAAETLSKVAVTYGLSVIGALIILIVGFWAAGRARKLVERLLGRMHGVDPMLGRFLGNVTRYIIIIVTVLAVLSEFGVQTASLFPDISVTGIVELLSNSLSNLISSDSIQAVGQGQIGFPVLDFGRGKAMVGKAKAAADESYLSYQRTVLGALNDTETALSNVASARSERDAAAQIVANAASTLRSAEVAHDSGLTNFAPVLQQRIAYREAMVRLVQAEASVRMATVALFKALGGGWSADEQPSHGAADNEAP